MMMDITNIGHYRLTSHGGKSFVLFNRQDDLVYNISEDDYRFVKNLQTVTRCKEVEYLYLKHATNMALNKKMGVKIDVC